jgi:hypothetical protein
VRSSPGTTLTSLGTGRYDVTFKSNIVGCAYLATVDDPGANGLIARGSSLTSSFLLGAGQYTVVADMPALACATVATPGSADQSLPTVPTTVELMPGPASNTAVIQVTLLLGGTLADVAFHAAIIC